MNNKITGVHSLDLFDFGATAPCHIHVVIPHRSTSGVMQSVCVSVSCQLPENAFQFVDVKRLHIAFMVFDWILMF